MILSFIAHFSFKLIQTMKQNQNWADLKTSMFVYGGAPVILYHSE